LYLLLKCEQNLKADVTGHCFFRLLSLDAECQIQFWKTLEGPSTIKEHVIVYEERKECLTPSSTSATKLGRGVRTAGHVYNLWPATTVSARIVAVNGNYEGLPSATITFRTKEGGRHRGSANTSVASSITVTVTVAVSKCTLNQIY